MAQTPAQKAAAAKQKAADDAAILKAARAKAAAFAQSQKDNAYYANFPNVTSGSSSAMNDFNLAQEKEDAYIAGFDNVTSGSSSGLWNTGDYTSTGSETDAADANDAAAIVPPADTAANNDRTDAFNLIKLTLQDYGFTKDELNELFSYIEKGLLDPKMGANQMVLELRTLPVYKARFAGNETRVSNGLNALSEADYKRQEDSYAEYLTAGGVSKLGTRATYAKLIGGAVSPTEVGKRVNKAVDRVVNSDPEIMKMIYKYNPTISQQDLVSYFLDPAATLPELEKKVSMGEIGAAASQAGMDYGFGRIEDLQKYGVDRAQAIAGYGNIGQVLPTATKLGNIYSESGVKYDQTAGESEFFKSDANAMEKRRQLKSLERAQFSGSAGVNASSLEKNTQGAF